MAVLAALTLIVGVAPDLFLKPITTYISGVFAGNHNVLTIPHSGSNGGTTSTIPTPPITPKQTSFTTSSSGSAAKGGSG
jgi:hypothetical protein